MDDEGERTARPLLLGKAAVSAHRFERPLAAEMDKDGQSRAPRSLGCPYLRGGAGCELGPWGAPRVGAVDDLGVVDPLQIYSGDAEVGVAELALDNEQGARPRTSSTAWAWRG